jgi:hypothetical protein
MNSLSWEGAALSVIVWDQIIEGKGLLLGIQILQTGRSCFTFFEGGPLPPHVAGVQPRDFQSKEEALAWVESNYLPGRKTFGWNEVLSPFPASPAEGSKLEGSHER